MLPLHVVHADWSMNPDKRWSAEAVLKAGAYHAQAAVKVTPSRVLEALRIPGTILGFDFPIGVPRKYAALANAQGHAVGHFVPWLRGLGQAPWDRFFDVATSADQISLARPFFPFRPGGTNRGQLVAQLGVHSFEELFRRCDTAQGRQACAIFWTLGGNQVGKGTITGWRDVLQPALLRDLIRIWPFDGDLANLIGGDRAVVVETYPGDTYSYVGATLPETRNKGTGAQALKRSGPPTQGKKSAASRAASAGAMIAWAASAGIVLEPALQTQISGGFGPSKEGEDPFDAVAGLFGMIAVLTGKREAGLPAGDALARDVEGWILGRQP